MFLLLLLLRKQVLIPIKRRSTKEQSNHLYIYFLSVLDYLTTGVGENFNLQQVKGFVHLNAPQAKTLGSAAGACVNLLDLPYVPTREGTKCSQSQRRGARPGQPHGEEGWERRESLPISGVTEVPDLWHIQPQSL